MSIKVDASELGHFKVTMEKYSTEAYNGIKEAVKQSTYSITRKAKENITTNKTVDTGYLRNSIHSKVSALEGTVSTNVKYAKVIEEGSRPHIIRAKNKKYLYWAGASHPVKQVRHPGTKAYPFLQPALDNEIPVFLKRLERAIEPPNGGN